MDFEEFSCSFQTEKQCLDYLFQLRWPQGYRCPRCQWNEMWPIAEYKYKCKKCGYQTTVTAGTLFQDTHIPLAKWFRAAWYISIRPELATYSRIQQELNLGSRHTSQLIVDKLRRAAFRPILPKLEGTVEIIKTSVMVDKEKHSIFIAAEVGEGQSGMMRLGDYKQYHQSSSEFIRNIIARDSHNEKNVILTEWSLDTKLLDEIGYIRKSSMGFRSSKTYDISFALQKEIDKFMPTTPFSEYLDTYCARMNSMKTPIEFNALLQNAVNLSPVTREQIIHKSENPHRQ